MPDWNTYPISQAHGVNGEQGVDLATPFHTPLTALYGGTVDQASYGPWGGLVDILAQVPGYGTLHEYLLHLDQIQVQVGQQVGAGQQVGLSGGQLSGGAHPVQPAYSTGPHVEAGFFQGAPFASPSIDPTALVQAGPAGGAQTLAFDPSALVPAIPIIGPLLGGAQSAQQAQQATAAGLNNIGAGIAQAGQAIGQIPTSIGHGLADFFVVGEQDISAWLKRQSVAFFVAALVLLVLFA